MAQEVLAVNCKSGNSARNLSTPSRIHNMSDFKSQLSMQSFDSASSIASTLRRSVSSHSENAFMKRMCSVVQCADVLRAKNGLRILASPPGGKMIRETAVNVEEFSSLATIGGTVVAVIALIVFAISIGAEFLRAVPIVNQVASESLNTEYFLPDVAITLSMDIKEAQALQLFVPEFLWVTIYDGMRERRSAERILTSQSGEICKLSAGYRRNVTHGDSGSTSWPVFCVLNSKDKLRGRFGDPHYNYLKIKISECNENMSSLAAAKTESKRTCANKSQREAELAKGLGVNIWFRFKRQDWQETRALKQAEGIVPSGWHWYVYHKIWLQKEVTDVLNLELRYNSARSNSPWDVSGVFPTDQRFEWFSFDRWDQSPSGTTSGDFEGRTLLIANTRMANEKYDISVRYITVGDFIKNVSGCWAVSFFIGGTLAATLMSCPCGRHDDVPSELGPLSLAMIAATFSVNDRRADKEDDSLQEPAACGDDTVCAEAECSEYVRLAI